VVGVPSERWGEQVVAFVVRDEGGEVDEDALITHVRERLSAHKCPKRVFAIEALPVGETGKVRRAELVELAETRAKES
jgi:acyl-CoA synthetase (AMP-forming)/AMP-acid ligase II